jgi:hypothetical protein
MAIINPAQIPKSNFLLSNSFIFSTLCCRRSTFVESPLQIHLFMRNKPNFRKPKMNISNYITKTYKNIIPLALPKNKPNQTQFQTRPLSKPFRKFTEDRSAALRMTWGGCLGREPSGSPITTFEYATHNAWRCLWILGDLL